MKKILLLLLTIAIGCTQSQNKPNSTINNTDNSLLKKDLIAITQTKERRNYKNIETLNTIAAYIKAELHKVCDSVAYQKYKVNTNEYKNVIGSIGLQHKERIIIGAHYDVFGDYEGADDNASGVAGLLELARLLRKEKLSYRIDFVAYTLEEPPFFRTQQMGSYIHANYLFKHKIPVKGMICLETIGYYNEQPNSQEYPVKGMHVLYGTKGNFITIVQNEKSGKFGSQIEHFMKKESLLETQSFKGSSNMTGVDFSDHLNYWNFDYEAVMITNTAFYRNKNYHKKGDKLETLNLEKIKLVIEELHRTIVQL